MKTNWCKHVEDDFHVCHFFKCTLTLDIVYPSLIKNFGFGNCYTLNLLSLKKKKPNQQHLIVFKLG